MKEIISYLKTLEKIISAIDSFELLKSYSIASECLSILLCLLRFGIVAIEFRLESKKQTKKRKMKC